MSKGRVQKDEQHSSYVRRGKVALISVRNATTPERKRQTKNHLEQEEPARRGSTDHIVEWNGGCFVACAAARRRGDKPTSSHERQHIDIELNICNSAILAITGAAFDTMSPSQPPQLYLLDCRFHPNSVQTLVLRCVVFFLLSSRLLLKIAGDLGLKQRHGVLGADISQSSRGARGQEILEAELSEAEKSLHI
ncbi:hypothetical protein J6590_035306 [Homalodisca vitripennis]|nr:hypothetical protein J6590_035306 [Homalodisca vitripennis]